MRANIYIPHGIDAPAAWSSRTLRTARLFRHLAVVLSLLLVNLELARADETAAPPAAAATGESLLPEGLVHGADAPGWVRERPARVGDDPARVVVSDPRETLAECEADLRGKVERLLQAYAAEHLGSGPSGAPEPIEVPAQLVRSCVRESYTSTRATSLGTMQEVYQLVVLDASVRVQLEDRLRRRAVHRRLGTVAWGCALVAAAVAITHLQLRSRARRSTLPATSPRLA